MARAGRKHTRTRPSEIREDYHSLLLDFRVECELQGFSFVEGMTKAIELFRKYRPICDDGQLPSAGNGRVSKNAIKAVDKKATRC